MNQTLYTNGNIYMERDVFAKAMLITDGIISSVGTEEEVRAKATNPEIVDLHGRTVIPGFNDSHLHLFQVGEYLARLNLYQVSSIDEIVTLGRNFIRENALKAGMLLSAQNWNQDYFEGEKRELTRHDLDSISTEHPLIFTRVCCHVATINTKALELLGIDETFSEVNGGEIDREENGYPSGILRENAVMLTNQLMDEQTIEYCMDGIRKALLHANRQGITSIQTNDMKNEHAPLMWEAYERLAQSGELTARAYHQICFTDHALYEEWLKKGLRTKDGSPFNKVGPLKLFVDGSLGARTALMRADYHDMPNERGITCLPQSQLDRFVETSEKNDMQVIVHAIGDRAIEMVLDAYQTALSGNQNRLRHAINHCQITDIPLLERFRDMDISAHVQPIFLNYDIHMVEDRVGHNLASTSYAFHTMDKLGVHVSYGTDAPVEDLQTMPNIHCAVNRQDTSLFPEGGWFPTESVDVTRAIDNYTIGSAYSSFEETVKGRISPGYYADFVILDKNIFDIPKNEILDVQVLETILAGNTVYKA